MKIRLSIVFIIFMQSICAQDLIEYFGALKLNDTSLITYKISFEEDNGKIEGYSLTDLGGDHETKSLLIGSYNADTGDLYFHEKDIVYTKSPITHDKFCFVNFYAKNYKLRKSKDLDGDFQGKYEDGKKCIDGELLMVIYDKVEKKTKKLTKKINRIKRIEDSIKEKVNPTKMLDTLNMNVLRKNQVTSVFTNSKKIDLVVYDGGQDDGDVITISVNGKVIIKNFKISSTKKIIPINLDSNKTSIKLVAENVGSISTNTAVLELFSEEHNIRALTNLKRGESTQLDLIKRRKKP